VESGPGGKRSLISGGRPLTPSGPRERLEERLRFLRSFLAHPRQVGSIVPTSQRTVRRMLDLAPLADAGLLVELGAGTGPYTAEILRRLGPQARYLAFEIDPALATGLAESHRDPRLEVIADSAANLEAHLDGARPDVLVSALPFTSLPGPVRSEILAVMGRVLAPGGVALVLQYSPLVQRDLQRTFGTVERHLSPMNVPPAVLFACRPAAGDAR
jgi:phospholipid N-methyltransferase